MINWCYCKYGSHLLCIESFGYPLQKQLVKSVMIKILGLMKQKIYGLKKITISKMRRSSFPKQMWLYFILPVIKAVRHLFWGKSRISMISLSSQNNSVFLACINQYAKHFEIFNVFHITLIYSSLKRFGVSVFLA